MHGSDSNLDPDLTPRRLTQGILKHPFFLFVLLSTGLIAGIFLSNAMFSVGFTLLAVAWGTLFASAALLPRLPAYRKRCARRKERREAEENRLREMAILRTLPPDTQERYHSFCVCLHQAKRTQNETFRSNKPLATHTLAQQLERLPELYLRLITELDRICTMLSRVDEHQLRQDIDSIDHEIQVASDRVREVKRARRTVMQRRLQHIENAREHREITHTRLLMLEDLVIWLQEAHVALDDPIEVETRLEELTSIIDATEELNSIEDSAYTSNKTEFDELEWEPATVHETAQEPAHAYTQ